MTVSASLDTTLAIGSQSIKQRIVRTSDHENNYVVVLPVAHVASAWVKTSASIAACNLPALHGVVNGLVDVYWTGGKRVGVTVAVTTNALALTDGTGTDFPATANATVTIYQPTVVNTQIDGDAIAIMGACLEYADPASVSKGYLDLQDASHASIEALSLDANAPLVYDITGGASNVFTGNVVSHAHASHGDAVYEATLKILSLEDATP